MDHSGIDFIEKKYGVNVDVSDNDGKTHVYAYTDDGDRVGFEFNSMNTDVSDILVIAQGIDGIRTMANKRPRVGKPIWVK